MLDRLLGGAVRATERAIERREPRFDGPLDPARFDWVPRLEAAYPQVRAELEAVLASGVRPPETGDVMASELGTEGHWSTLILYSFGTWLDFNTRRFPVTTALVRTVPGVQIAGFSILHGGSHIPRHRGPSKTVRYHLGVIVPDPPGVTRLAVGDEVHEWAEGRSVLFDDATEHEAWNDSVEDRYVLFLEVLWPLPPLLDRLNRSTQWLMGLAARDVPARAAELDAALNP